MKRLRERLAARARKPAPLPQYKVYGEIKTEKKVHDWRVVGGYDPFEDGDDRRLARYAVMCARCGERRRVGAIFERFVTECAFGCVRKDFDGRFQPGDLVTVEMEHGFGGERLDCFLNYLDGGLAATSNAGGSMHIQPVEKLRPYVPEWLAS